MQYFSFIVLLPNGFFYEQTKALLSGDDIVIQAEKLLDNPIYSLEHSNNLSLLTFSKEIQEASVLSNEWWQQQPEHHYAMVSTQWREVIKQSGNEALIPPYLEISIVPYYQVYPYMTLYQSRKQTS